MQGVVATHSPELLDANRQAMQTHLMGAGHLLRANALEPGALFDDLIDQSPLFEDLFDVDDDCPKSIASSLQPIHRSGCARRLRDLAQKRLHA